MLNAGLRSPGLTLCTCADAGTISFHFLHVKGDSRQLHTGLPGLNPSKAHCVYVCVRYIYTMSFTLTMPPFAQGALTSV